MPDVEGRPRRLGSVTWETVRRLALALPGAAEGTSYGTPAFRVRGKLFVRFHQDGDSVVVNIDGPERAMRRKADPQAFYITDHYTGSSWILVRLSAIRRDDLRDLLEESWRRRAPQRLVAAYETAQPRRLGQ
jgi:hypothetical protein